MQIKGLEDSEGATSGLFAHKEGRGPSDICRLAFVVSRFFFQTAKKSPDQKGLQMDFHEGTKHQCSKARAGWMAVGATAAGGKPCGREFVSSVSNAEANEVVTKADKLR